MDRVGDMEPADAAFAARILVFGGGQRADARCYMQARLRRCVLWRGGGQLSPVRLKGFPMNARVQSIRVNSKQAVAKLRCRAERFSGRQYSE